MNNVFRALDDPIRRRILELLSTSDLSAGEIASHFNVSKPSISHHLDILKQAQLVISQRNGQYQVYSANLTVFQEISSWLMSMLKSNDSQTTKGDKSDETVPDP